MTTSGPAPNLQVAQPINNNVISTRRGQWSGLFDGTGPVTGTWILSFAPGLVADPLRIQRLRQLFDSKHLDDILFVITYRGKLPAWTT